jgi:hypothetical protein
MRRLACAAENYTSSIEVRARIIGNVAAGGSRSFRCWNIPD